jgi:hypothetical protein
VGRPRLRWVKVKKINYKSEKRADGERREITYRKSVKADEGSSRTVEQWNKRGIT